MNGTGRSTHTLWHSRTQRQLSSLQAPLTNTAAGPSVSTTPYRWPRSYGSKRPPQTSLCGVPQPERNRQTGRSRHQRRLDHKWHRHQAVLHQRTADTSHSLLGRLRHTSQLSRRHETALELGAIQALELHLRQRIPNQHRPLNRHRITKHRRRNRPNTKQHPSQTHNRQHQKQARRKRK